MDLGEEHLAVQGQARSDGHVIPLVVVLERASKNWLSGTLRGTSDRIMRF
jgi:hypothetical protein